MTGHQVADRLASRVVRAVREYRNRLPEIRLSAGTGSGTIYYVVPDFDQPAGGVQAMYRHVDALNDAGIDAAVLHGARGYRCTWFEHRTRVTDTARTRVGSDDLLVVPEIFIGVLRKLPPAQPHVILNQGAHHTFPSRTDPDGIAAHYASSPGLAGVMSVSDHSVEFLRYAFPGRDVRRVHLGIDAETFHPGPTAPGRTITYMPRRANRDATNVLQILKSRGALEGWELRPLAGLSHHALGDALRDSSVFLHFTYQEGFGLPPAEAMACGNLVVGFDGFGGREFFLPEFSHPVPTGDVLAFARAVERVLKCEAAEPGWCRSRGLAASEFVLSRYRPEIERAEVVEFFRQVRGLGGASDTPTGEMPETSGSISVAR